jgi:hypothetical protein
LQSTRERPPRVSRGNRGRSSSTAAPHHARAEQSRAEHMLGDTHYGRHDWSLCWQWCLSYNVQQTRAVGRNPGSARERERPTLRHGAGVSWSFDGAYIHLVSWSRQWWRRPFSTILWPRKQQQDTRKTTADRRSSSAPTEASKQFLDRLVREGGNMFGWGTVR